jgi:hypothetical protein
MDPYYGEYDYYNNQFLYENIMNLDESEDENYEEAASNRVNAVISNILNDGEEEEALQYIPPEKQSVYYVYTDEGAMREDPGDAEK